MEEEDSLYDYSTPVHRSLLEPDIILGIGVMPAVAIFIFTTILVMFVNFWCILIGIALFMIAKILCRKDPYMLIIVFDRILLPNYWRCI